MAGSASPQRMSGVWRGTRLLFFLLLLELALLFFQHVISYAIRKERGTLDMTHDSLAAQREEYAFRSDQLKIYETEELKFKQKLPRRIENASQALAQTRETLRALGIAGAVMEKTHSGESVVLEAVCEGNYAGLSALIDALDGREYAVRLDKLTVEALGDGLLRFIADIEYVFNPDSQGFGY